VTDEELDRALAVLTRALDRAAGSSRS